MIPKNKKTISKKENKALNRMNTYRAKIRDKRTKQFEVISITASSITEARSMAIKQGTVLSIKKKLFSFSSGVELSSADRFIFLTRLAMMVSSKLGVGESLKLIRDTFNGKISKAASVMLKKIEQGMDIGQAMETMGTAAFPSGMTALVQAGIRGGNTGKALKDAANFEQELNDIKKQSNQGMLSAIVGFMVAGGFLVGSSFYLAPKVKDSPIFRDSPVDTSIIDVVADVMGIFMLVVMVGFIGLLTLGSVLRQIVPNWSDKIIMKIPFYRDIVMAKNSYATLYGLSMLIGSGVRIEESLRITMENSPRGALKTDTHNAWQAIRRGDSKWPKHMSTLHPTDQAALMTSSNREDVALALNELSSQYRRLYGERLKMIVPTLQLISAMLLSVAGAIMFAQIILPMLKMTEGII